MAVPDRKPRARVADHDGGRASSRCCSSFGEQRAAERRCPKLGGEVRRVRHERVVGLWTSSPAAGEAFREVVADRDPVAGS